MKNETFINGDGIVEVIYHSDQTVETVSVLVDNIQKLIKDKPGKVKYLIDLSDVGSTTIASRKTVVSKIKLLRIEKQAIFGGNAYTRNLMNLMLRVVNQGGRLRYFDDRQAAVAWLKG